MRLSALVLSLTVVAIAVAVAISGFAGGKGEGGKAVAQSKATQTTHMDLVEQRSDEQTDAVGGATHDPTDEGGTSAAQTSEGGSAAGSASTVTLIVKSDDEHGKKGPEGKWHDAFLPADFTVKPGQKVNVVVLNYDEGKHSFTSPMLGLNVTIDEGSLKEPHKTTFSFTAPSKAGEYEWFCDYPCDPWAMTHKGFMRGDVTVS